MSNMSNIRNMSNMVNIQNMSKMANMSNMNNMSNMSNMINMTKHARVPVNPVGNTGSIPYKMRRESATFQVLLATKRRTAKTVASGTLDAADGTLESSRGGIGTTTLSANRLFLDYFGHCHHLEWS